MKISGFIRKLAMRCAEMLVVMNIGIYYDEDLMHFDDCDDAC